MCQLIATSPVLYPTCTPSHTHNVLYVPPSFSPPLELVWKVARYTSAGPTYFSECDDFVDGGVLANNPCTTSWVEICDYYDKMVSHFVIVHDFAYMYMYVLYGHLHVKNICTCILMSLCYVESLSCFRQIIFKL